MNFREIAMSRRMKIGVAVLVAALSVQAGLAQGDKAAAEAKATAESKADTRIGLKNSDFVGAKFYHLEFVVKELEGGKVINSRSYSMSVAKRETGGNFTNRSLRTGTKVLIQAEAGKTSYYDVGVSIDCRELELIQNELAMNLSAEISSLQGGGDGTQGGIPTILQNRWNSEVIVQLGKPTVIFSSDDVTSKRTLQLELTATPIKE
jgi:hypothetical protein